MEGSIPWGCTKREQGACEHLAAGCQNADGELSAARARAVPVQDGTTSHREAVSFSQLLHFPPQESDHPQMSNAPEISLTIPHAK